MSLSNLDNASNIKTLVCRCFPTELVVLSDIYATNIRRCTYVGYIKEIKSSAGISSKKTSKDNLVSDHDWFHDRDKSILYYRMLGSSSVSVVVTFGFFFKTGDTEPLHVDINDLNSELVMYDGRMNETSFIQSIDDVSNGVLSCSSTSISLINNDGFYQTLCKDAVSFKNAALEVWIFYNVVPNNCILFKGYIESATFRSKEVIFEAKDFNKILQNVAKFTSVESEYVTDKTTYPSMLDTNVGKEIPFLLGRSPSAAIEKIDISLGILEHVNDQPWLVTGTVKSWDQSTEQNKIIPISRQSKVVTVKDQHGETISTETVRSLKHVSYRIINNIKTNNRIMLVNSMVTDLNPDKTTTDGEYITYGAEVEIPVSDCNNYFVGQQCFWYSAVQSGESGELFTETWGRNVGWHRISFLNYAENRIRIAPTFQENIFGPGTVANRSYIWFTPVSVSFIDSSKNVYVLPCTVTSYLDNVSSGQLLTTEVARFSMANGFYGYGHTNADNTQFLIGGINVAKRYDSPTTNDNTTELEDYNFFTRFLTNSDNLSLGCILHRTLIEAGYETDGGTDRFLAVGTNSFRHIDTKLGETYFTLHTGMVDTYLELLQMMLSSIFGFMYVQEDGKIGVRLFEREPYNSALYVISEDDIVKDSIQSDFNSGGIYTRLRATNDINAEFSSERKDSNRILLHGDLLMDNKYHFESKSIYESKVMPRKYEYLSASVRKFEFTIINRGYEILLGDRININFSQSNMWLGSPKEYELFVIGVNKSLQGTLVTAIENSFPSLT